MKFYLIAGEASGDLHGSNLMRELKPLIPNVSFRFWGGDLMLSQGGELVKHYRDLAFMGFTEVLLNLRIILRNIDFCKKDILSHKPDVLILIDYPGFNLRIAEFASKNGIRVFYYISPQVWAWKKSRVFKIKKYVERMFVILPFEKEFYAKYDYQVDFVGHPLLDVINLRSGIKHTVTEFTENNKLDNRPIIAILPGSRRQEIEMMLPVMCKMISLFPDYQFVISGVSVHKPEFYNKLIGDRKGKILYGQTYDLLEHSYAAMVTSGTATLETALFGVPEVVCYKGGEISFQIAKRLVKIDYISLVNLISGKEVVKELIQQEFNSKYLKLELGKLVNDQNFRRKMIEEFEKLKAKLGMHGASAKAAKLIAGYIKENPL